MTLYGETRKLPKRKSNWLGTTVTSVFCIAASAGIAASVYLSPFWSLHQLKNAINTQDVAGIEAGIDFPAIRMQLKEQMLERQKVEENPLAALAGTFAIGLVTPENAAIFLAPKDGKGEEFDPSGLEVAYVNINHVTLTREDEDKKAKMHMRRSGLWSWKIYKVEGLELGAKK